MTFIEFGLKFAIKEKSWVTSFLEVVLLKYLPGCLPGSEHMANFLRPPATGSAYHTGMSLAALLCHYSLLDSCKVWGFKAYSGKNTSEPLHCFAKTLLQIK